VPLPSLSLFSFSRSNTAHTYKTSGGRPGIGMGLQQSGPGVSTGTREVFGRLEVGEGGEVKRMRRG
jgi:hypothetical protein